MELNIFKWVKDNWCTAILGFHFFTGYGDLISRLAMTSDLETD